MEPILPRYKVNAKTEMATAPAAVPRLSWVGSTAGAALLQDPLLLLLLLVVVVL